MQRSPRRRPPPQQQRRAGQIGAHLNEPMQSRRKWQLPPDQEISGTRTAPERSSVPARSPDPATGCRGLRPRVCHDAAADLSALTRSPPRPRVRPSRLVEQVDRLLRPAHEVAGGEIGLVEHVVERSSPRPRVHRPREPVATGSEPGRRWSRSQVGEHGPQVLRARRRVQRNSPRGRPRSPAPSRRDAARRPGSTRAPRSARRVEVVLRPAPQQLGDEQVALAMRCIVAPAAVTVVVPSPSIAVARRCEHVHSAVGHACRCVSIWWRACRSGAAAFQYRSAQRAWLSRSGQS